MGKILEDSTNNLFVYIYSDDHLPPHVHVFVGKKRSRSDKNIRISIGDDNNAPKILRAHPKIKNSDIHRAWQLVADNQDKLLIEWKKIHGSEEMEERNQ
ncbi:DUF4160 domain-containing protein [Leptolyngbya sp. DQ-M1]|uniref:DUF4160 domain-containing protein n=1 Tax=Leptolyngbya sp. DQ-M1 TaxID=2933920 RepID=UPI0032997C84